MTSVWLKCLRLLRDKEEVITVGVVGVGLLDDIYCRNARGAVGGTLVLRARGEAVEAEGACWREAKH